MTDNLRHWDALSKTDPKHTKPFQRAGGFKGTAIKPIWSAKQMTEHFGPCGAGWGMEKPEFVTMPVGDEILVYCTVALWYREEGTEGHIVYGVGGDKVAVKRNDGKITADDEAFKKAYTDALSNAMKQIGVGADVHMGLFDDAKYVNEMRQEFAEGDTPANTAKAPPPPQTGQETGASEFDARAAQVALAKAIDDAPHLQGLNMLMSSNGQRTDSADPTQGSKLWNIKQASETGFAFLIDRANKRRAMLSQAPGTQRKAS